MQLTNIDYSIYDYVFAMLLQVAYESTLRSRFGENYIVLKS